MPHFYLATCSSQIEQLRALWDSVYSPERHTLFQSYEWNLLATKVFGARSVPYVVAVEDDSGAAIMPACTMGDRAYLIGDELFDYRDVLLQADEEPMTAAVRALADLGMRFHLTAVRGNASCEQWRSAGFVPEPFVMAPCVRKQDMDAEAFEAHHNRSARLVRRLTRAGVCFYERSGNDAALVRSIYERKSAQVLEGKPNLLADSARREFLVAACALGACDVFTYESAGTLVAGLVTFRDANVRRFYTIYYDYAWAPYSPGVALLFEVTRRSLSEGLDCDYMTGEQPHKMRFATSSVPLFRVNASAAQLAEIASGAKLVAA